ncbi:hypothetical protein MAR_011985 [Mya arenaria]|uniref:Uncharacterized protein n=1 Tax=Mya arenaria TaxID=6604 RepID=A0ABY7FZP3_MYAAR|nr:hypothetical protein MAR_011985 [Mya arenaria]
MYDKHAVLGRKDVNKWEAAPGVVDDLERCGKHPGEALKLEGRNRREMENFGPDVLECFRLYGQYKVCPDNTCLHENDTCHLSTEAVQTGSEAGYSMAVVVTISSLCVLFCIAVAAIFVVLFARRTGRHKSEESNSATEPLRKCYISESSDSRDDSDRFPVRAKTYYRKCESSEEITNGYFIYNPAPEKNDFFATENENHQAFSVFKRNSDDNDIQKENLIGENAEINDPDRNELSPELIDVKWKFWDQIFGSVFAFTNYELGHIHNRYLHGGFTDRKRGGDLNGGRATEPLRKCYISESSDSRDDSDRFPVRAKTYYWMCESSEENSKGYLIYNPLPERNDFFATENKNHQASSVFKRNSDDNDSQKEILIGGNAEINDPDRNEISPELIDVT